LAHTRLIQSLSPPSSIGPMGPRMDERPLRPVPAGPQPTEYGWPLTAAGTVMSPMKMGPPFTAAVYNFARIDISPVPIGSGQQGLKDRTTFRFDFSGVPFPISSVTWEWYDPGAGGTLGGRPIRDPDRNAVERKA
jgi:hypothetical protein